MASADKKPSLLGGRPKDPIHNYFERVKGDKPKDPMYRCKQEECGAVIRGKQLCNLYDHVLTKCHHTSEADRV